MNDKQFSKKVLEDLQEVRDLATSDVVPRVGESDEEFAERRKEQYRTIKPHLITLRRAGYHSASEFIALKEQWDGGMLLNKKQEAFLVQWASNVEYLKCTNINAEGVALHKPFMKLVYQKVLGELQTRPNSKFLMDCRIMLEGQEFITPNMLKALLNIK